jgi:hypothetical protein
MVAAHDGALLVKRTSQPKYEKFSAKSESQKKKIKK